MNKEVLFLENFYTLLNSGYSVEESLNLCEEILNLKFINDMKEKLSYGEDIYQIISDSQLPIVFKEYFEFYKNKNCLSDAIEKSLNVYKTNKSYLHKLKSKLSYPTILLVFLFFFSVFVVFFLLPNVNELFVSFQINKSVIINALFTFFYLFPLLFIVLFFIVVFNVVKLINKLKNKKFKVIEYYLKMPVINIILKKYFSLKFSIYYHELALEDMDSAAIIQVLNNQMNESDIKIVLYEMNNRISEGEAIERILEDFEYLDSLFISFFKMYISNPNRHEALQHYIQMTYNQIDQWISQFLKYIVPCIYGFVALFVITIYISIIIPMMNIISGI